MFITWVQLPFDCLIIHAVEPLVSNWQQVSPPTTSVLPHEPIRFLQTSSYVSYFDSFTPSGQVDQARLLDFQLGVKILKYSIDELLWTNLTDLWERTEGVGSDICCQFHTRSPVERVIKHSNSVDESPTSQFHLELLGGTWISFGELRASVHLMLYLLDILIALSM